MVLISVYLKFVLFTGFLNRTVLDCSKIKIVFFK